jgi:SNF2 family DNA or RNA helicase
MIDVSNLDWSRCKYPPFDHQIAGVVSLIKCPTFGLLDEMGAGKTKQIIDTACFLYEDKKIDVVVIVCPAQVKDVWIHPKFSQIIEHAFVPGRINEFTSSTDSLSSSDKGLIWVVTSVELLRNMTHVKSLVKLLKGRKFWCVVDESSTISNPRASQTKGCMVLGRAATRRTILNGTPIGNSPLNLYSQFEFLDPMILGFRNYYTFRNRHAKMGGYMNKQVVGFYDLEDIQKKIKPFVLRRLKRDCMDLPPRIDLPVREVKLSAATWAKYVQMREEFVAYLGDFDTVSTVTTAPVKALRLAQMCSGFLGGVLDSESESDETLTVEISRELTDNFLANLEYRLSIDPNYKLIVWCRFRPEIARLKKMVTEMFPDMTVKVLQGGMNRKDRDEARGLFHPDAPDPPGPALLIGQPQAGRFGLNFTKCSNVDRLSTDYSYLTWSQSNDRVDRPGQKFTMSFQDYLVVGPKGERTVSGIIHKALRTHAEVASWTCSKWVEEIMKETDDDIPF